MDLQPQRSLPSSGAARLLAESKEYFGRCDYQQAIQILQRARGLEPENERVLLQLGFAFAQAYNFSEAEKFFENAVRVSFSKANTLVAAGHHWMDVRHFEAAKNYFARALQENPASIVALIRLAEIYIRLRQLDNAAEVSERALKIDANHEGALLTRGKVHRQKQELEAAEKILREAIARSSTSGDIRAAACYELGAVLDGQARYDEAMGAFLEAKTLLKSNSAAAASTCRVKQARMKETLASVTPALLERWRKFGETQLQPPHKLVLLSGHARSGTTLLEYVLDSHPQIVSADETAVFQSKSYAYISRELSPKTSLLSALDSLPARTLRQVRADYFCGAESFLGQRVGDRLLVDKNPALTYDIPSVARIFPETKFIIALRDPRDVCLSCFMQAWPLLPDTVPWLSLETTIQHYALLTSYWQALKPCLGEFALEVRYEDTVENVEATARRTLEFLGLPWNERVLHFYEDAQKKIVRSPTFAEVGKPIYKTAIARWKNYEKYFEPHLKTLEPVLKSLGYG